MNQLAMNRPYNAVTNATSSFQRLHVAAESRSHEWNSDSDSEDEGHAMPSSAACSLPASRPADGVDVARGQTRYGATVQIYDVPAEILAKVDKFYVCEHCGKCYWDGSHRDRFLKSVQFAISLTQEK